MDKKNIRKEVWLLAKDALIALVIVGIFLSSILVYTSNWPPMVVVESGSMTHGWETDDSRIGIIDPGDLVLVKSVSSREDIVTYVEGAEEVFFRVHIDGVLEENTVPGRHYPHETYGAPGDVIVFYRDGDEAQTPIIHRAIVWLEYNETADSFDAPDLGLYNMSGTLRIHLSGDVRLNILDLDLSTLSRQNHDGFITLGDNNGQHDQRTYNQVMVEWIYGKARGEIPWFGAIKLYAGGGGSAVPSNAWRNIVLTVIGVVAAAIFTDIATYIYSSRKTNKEEDNSGENGKEGEEQQGEHEGERMERDPGDGEGDSEGAFGEEDESYSSSQQ